MPRGHAKDHLSDKKYSTGYNLRSWQHSTGLKGHMHARPLRPQVVALPDATLSPTRYKHAVFWVRVYGIRAVRTPRMRSVSKAHTTLAVRRRLELTPSPSRAGACSIALSAKCDASPSMIASWVRPKSRAACLTAYGYAAWKRSKSLSPVRAIPSSTMRARVIKAKYSGTVKGKSKKIWLSCREMAENCARRVAIEPPLTVKPCVVASRPCSKMLRSGGSSAARSTSAGRKRSFTASSTSASTSPRIRCTSAEVSAAESKEATSAQSPKSMRTSRPCASTSRLPGWGSEWKNPTASSCARKQSTPVAMSPLMTAGGDLASCSPSIHSVTSTLRVVHFV
mmetsp:Transcript_11955/g.27678  ORF Transcript_11955/g.27678 Transcript_11955/m.27678 type:complete len:338 (+) Transcript_11955:86-1099(+)